MADTDKPSRGVTVPLALKFFIGSAFLIALAVATAVIVTYIQGNRIAARAVDTALSTSTAVQKEIEQSRLDQLQLKLQQIAADPSTVKYISQASGTTNNLPGLSESSDTDTKSIPDLLKERQTQFNFDLAIALDGKGIVLGRSDQTEAFQESLANDPVLVKPAIEQLQPFSGYWREGDKLYQAAIIPLGQDQDLVGFLLLAQRVNDELSTQMAKISGAQIAFWLPQDNQLRLVASSLPEADAKALQEARQHAGAGDGRRGRFRTADSAFVAAIRRTEVGFATRADGGSEQGQSRRGAGARIDGQDHRELSRHPELGADRRRAVDRDRAAAVVRARQRNSASRAHDGRSRRAGRRRKLPRADRLERQR